MARIHHCDRLPPGARCLCNLCEAQRHLDNARACCRCPRYEHEIETAIGYCIMHCRDLIDDYNEGRAARRSGWAR